MHEDRIPEEEMDEEYYLFAGEGKFWDVKIIK
jgi:hypothetical protein